MTFCPSLCLQLGVKDVACIHARAEEQALLPQYREQFDVAVSRAVAGLAVLCELCLPFVRTGGAFLAMKTISCDEEMASAAVAIRLLGGEFLPHFDYAIPGTDIIRRIIRIQKVSPTPQGFPRRFAAIKKSPL